MKIITRVNVIVLLSLVLISLQSIIAKNYVIQKKCSKLPFNGLIMPSDTLKTILLYSVSNITDETMAKIEIQFIVRNGKIINAFAKVVENNNDRVNSVDKLTLSIENEFVILQVRLNNEFAPPNTNKQKWVGDVSASIFLGLNKDGNIKSFTFNSTVDDSNLRFGGEFLHQMEGVFKTNNVSFK